jgi:uncharacterized membrane protein YgaE (UPF0421/DUF939 family)
MEISRPFRAALAAVLAWLVVQPFGGLIGEYAYYAPLGAVIAVTATVLGSARESFQAIVAMAIGVALATASIALPEVLGLLVVVALGTVVAIAPWFSWLGTSGSLTPVTAMFVLVIGGDSPWDYAAAYLGLTTLGALVGLAVNLSWPPLPLGSEDAVFDQMREGLAEQLTAISEGLDGDRPPTPDEWAGRQHAIDLLVTEMRTVATHAAEARQANWRARRRGLIDARYEEARSYERLAFLVQDLRDLLAAQEHADRERVALGPRLRPYAARALRDLATALCETHGRDVDAEALARAETSVDALVHAMRGVRLVTGDDLLTAGAVVTTVGRTLASLTHSDVDRVGH